MKKIHIAITCIALLLSCSNNKKFYKQEVVEFLSQEKVKTFSQKEKGLVDISFYNKIPLFVSYKNDSLISTTNDQLYDVYSSKYSDKVSFSIFLSNVLNQKMKVDKSDFNNTTNDVFALNNQIAREYEEKGITSLLDKYCFKRENYIYINNEKLDSDNKFLSVMYFFSINNNYIEEDDIVGGRIIKSWDDIVKIKN